MGLGLGLRLGLGLGLGYRPRSHDSRGSSRSNQQIRRAALSLCAGFRLGFALGVNQQIRLTALSLRAPPPSTVVASPPGAGCVAASPSPSPSPSPSSSPQVRGCLAAAAQPAHSLKTRPRRRTRHARRTPRASHRRTCEGVETGPQWVGTVGARNAAYERERRHAQRDGEG